METQAVWKKNGISTIKKDSGKESQSEVIPGSSESFPDRLAENVASAVAHALRGADFAPEDLEVRVYAAPGGASRRKRFYVDIKLPGNPSEGIWAVAARAAEACVPQGDPTRQADIFFQYNPLGSGGNVHVSHF
jgi:hypothetical protein